MSRTAFRPAPVKSWRISAAFSSGLPLLTSESGWTSTPKSDGFTSYSLMSPSGLSSHTFDGPAIDSSSSPSQPWTTRARFMLSILKTSANSRPNSGEKTPQRMPSGFPGFVSGPSMLKIVRIPSSVRRRPTCFIAGWYDLAKRKAKPVFVKTAGTCLGASSSCTPRASSTSAAPLFDEALRFPCFTTEAPAPAATKEAAVEMLNVSWPSPPVPTMSITRSPLLGTSNGVAWVRITSAHAWTMAGLHLSRLSNAKKAPT
mmetsp:Transcript_101101/g.286553  ORF Transcript_101101/g.286553 Transcript_101101/m.286553 type:complete len:258 (-) Transcript_101101:195-968(-)